MADIVGITPEKALELTQQNYDWKKYVQSCLDCYVPVAAGKGERSCKVEFCCKNGVSLAECTDKVTAVLKELGWSVGDTSVSPHGKTSIYIEVFW